ncbi:MAG: IclR family transcriptional regulator [Chloroflexota bacterium]
MMAIQSIERAFDILGAIQLQEEGMRAAEIASQIDLPRTTVIRILGTLEQVGAVQRGENKRAFKIGPTIQKMASIETKENNLQSVARPQLESLANEAQETAYLCIRQGNQVCYLDQIDSQHHIRLQDWTGHYFPLHTTAAGKVFLSHFSKQQLEAYLSQNLVRFTDKTIVDAAQIRSYTKEIRHKGVAWTHGQTENGLVGVAAPIYSAAGEVIGSLALGGPAFRFPSNGAKISIEKLVIEKSNDISQKLRSLI